MKILLCVQYTWEPPDFYRISLLKQDQQEASLFLAALFICIISQVLKNRLIKVRAEYNKHKKEGKCL
jgi:hypothetical protein